MFLLELAITPSLRRALLRTLSVKMLPRLVAVLQEDRGTVDHTPLFSPELKKFAGSVAIRSSYRAYQHFVISEPPDRSSPCLHGVPRCVLHLAHTNSHL